MTPRQPASCFRLSLAFVLSCFAMIPGASAQTPAGAISGIVSNAGTGDLLEGVRVSAPALGLTTLSDATGRYVLSPVPAGSHEITASYTGLDVQRLAVVVEAGRRANRDFALTSGVYRLDAFTVAGEREGGAAAITAQRNAANVKNVVAMDSYGNLPNMSASELAILLPGEFARAHVR